MRHSQSVGTFGVILLVLGLFSRDLAAIFRRVPQLRDGERLLDPKQERLLAFSRDQLTQLEAQASDEGWAFRVAGFSALLTTVREGYQLEATYAQRGKSWQVQSTELKVEVDASSWLPVGLRVAAKQTSAGRLIEEAAQVVPIVRTMDPDFDQAFVVAGPYGECVALLESALRAAFLHDQSALTIRRGKIALTAHASIDQLEAITERVLALTELLDTNQRNIVQRLQRNALHDPLPDVRAQNLRCLSSLYPTAEETQQTLQSALDDPAPQVQILGAIALGEDGFALAQQIILDFRAPPSARAAGLDFLLSTPLPVEPVMELLKTLLRPPTPPTRLVELIQKNRYTPAAEHLVSLLPRCTPRAQRTLINTLGALRSPIAQRALLSLLSAEDPELALTSVRALGHIGNPEAIGPLRAKARGFFVDSTLRRAVLHSIEQIRLRGGAAETGRLSLAPGHDMVLGTVSLLPEGEGQLSIGPVRSAESAGSNAPVGSDDSGVDPSESSASGL